ncbi:MAG: hypothetical protein KG075_07660 [Alphaproteobacteria bacterium]|nr:hypothetical protein [Alphaproteobacteria bacterium]
MFTSTALHRHIDAMVGALRKGGFTVHLSNDPEAYKHRVAQVPGYSLTSPLDTAFVDVSDRFLWIEVRKDATPICIEVGRYLWAPRMFGGLNRLLKNREFFGTKRQVLPVLSRAPAINLSGRLGYMGGGFVEAAYRDQGIMSIVAQLTMAHLLRCFNVDHVFGLVRANHIGRSLQRKGYGFTSATTLSWAYWGDSAGPETLGFVHADRQALLDRLDETPDYALIKTTT